ncbi:MAG: ParB/RepB/Spo0J family partition protein [Rhizobiales bacterium]|nr:ParB/RepB/Spo0J family partition protein [Hyphomicrobiales bacterium]
MKHEPARPRLGRGLAALIGDSADEAPAMERTRGQRRVPIEFLRANPRNPRKSFAEADLEDLANSIRERGVIQPILVRSVPGAADAYEIVAGERRWRAAQAAGLHDVPILLIEAGDRDALEIAIIENVQRADLNPVEEALGYEQLAAQFGYSHQDLARVIGKSRSHIANTLRLLKLPETVRARLGAGELSAGHARALLAVRDPDSAAKQIVEQGLSVRDVERIAQRDAAEQARAPRARKEKDADTVALERALTEALGLVVQIEHRGENGEVRIRYKTLEQLDALCRRLNA